MQRIGLIIVPGIIAIALFVGINSFESLSNETGTPITSSSLDFNAYSEGINTILYDADGNINYTLQAERQVHYNDDSTEFEKPFIRLFQDGESRWNIVANSGRISADETTPDGALDRIELVGDVQVYSLDDFGNRTLMSTEFLTLNPESEILETDQPVSVVTSALQQSSTGMIANLKSDEITFLRDIRGRHAQATN
ncbi:MAG: LPS export ABC transporter periplasmic protein LptC [SAR86 cluster bacterium]|uniref:LPS export ABC transporter periplasmic protein LptC n=1 Tax=SAR86 cluster bacterium TaxID=2030880 RepID=A0A2A4XIK4_9GAMM|nr:MAG: LPS export ABC transporter periplasmic protein LptC [SAR86 cluster bacterium]